MTPLGAVGGQHGGVHGVDVGRIHPDMVSLIIYQVGSLFTGNVNVIGLIFAILFIALIIFQLARPYKESETLLLKNKAKASV